MATALEAFGQNAEKIIASFVGQFTDMALHFSSIHGWCDIDCGESRAQIQTRMAYSEDDSTPAFQTPLMMLRS